MLEESIDRRNFLRGAVGASALYLSGCGSRKAVPQAPAGFDGSGKIPGTDLKEPLTGGEFLEAIPFVREDAHRINVKFHKGHDARQILDLTSLIDPETRLTPTEKFFIRTEYPDLLRSSEHWKIKIHGHAREPKDLPIEDLQPFVAPQGACLIECSGNSGSGFGLLSVAKWSGIPFSKILELAPPNEKAKRVLISGFDERTTTSTHSTPGASWVFTLDELAKAKAFLATQINDVPLPPDHGAPLRLIVPNWYGCCDIKWLNEIRYVDDDEPVTAQMVEFATRTHQDVDVQASRRGGKPILASEFIPATLDLAAMPVRVEKWKLNGKLTYRVIGISWGGDTPSDKLAIRFRMDEEWEPVNTSVARLPDLPFGIWCHRWEPKFKGNFTLLLKCTDPGIRTRRLDGNFYARYVQVADV